jgi:hypothetical protein
MVGSRFLLKYSINSCITEMEMKKLHMGTMSYGFDSMDEVAHQLALAFGETSEQGINLSSNDS